MENGIEKAERLLSDMGFCKDGQTVEQAILQIGQWFITPANQIRLLFHSRGAKGWDWGDEHNGLLAWVQSAVMMADRMAWLQGNPDRLEDVRGRVNNEGCAVGDAIDWFMAQDRAEKQGAATASSGAVPGGGATSVEQELTGAQQDTLRRLARLKATP